jgi:VIT1/CCC1 family predicted Fe2+/Mn2+ transporter
MSMAAGEYVSVHSQADTEKADLALEREELRTDDVGEHKELAAIYVGRGLDPGLAKQVATQLMTHDALAAHARDELGISEALAAHPDSSRFVVSSQLCRRSGAATTRRNRHAAGLFNSGCGGSFSALSRDAWSMGSIGRWASVMKGSVWHYSIARFVMLPCYEPALIFL